MTHDAFPLAPALRRVIGINYVPAEYICANIEIGECAFAFTINKRCMHACERGSTNMFAATANLARRLFLELSKSRNYAAAASTREEERREVLSSFFFFFFSGLVSRHFEHPANRGAKHGDLLRCREKEVLAEKLPCIASRIKCSKMLLKIRYLTSTR